MKRRTFITSALAAGFLHSFGGAEEKKPRHILLRSSWQTENIGDIAHTPGMLALLEKYRPDDEITLWPNKLNAEVEKLLTARFPKLRIAKSKAEQDAALRKCDFFLHGSGPGLVGGRQAELARKAGKPYGFAGITLNDHEIKTQRNLLAAFIPAIPRHTSET